MSELNEPAAVEPMFKRRDLRRLLGNISGETLRIWLKDKKLPPPDISLSAKSQFWSRASLERAGVRLPGPAQMVPAAESNTPTPAAST